MKNTTFKYQKYDWEGISFPIVVSQIQSVTNHYIIPFDSELTIWRDNDYWLKGSIKGIVDDVNDLEYREKGEIKKVGFIHGETLKAKSKGSEFLIEGLGLNSLSLDPIQYDNGIKISFTCDIFLENIILINNSTIKSQIISEWYLCSLPEILFANRTTRYDKHPRYKIRNGIDLPIEKDFSQTKQLGSWDFVIVKYENYEIVIQNIQKDYLPPNIDGIAIEYRNIAGEFPTVEFRKMFREYISFILGTNIQKIGVSEYELGYKLLSCKSQNPWKRSIKKNRNINPIPLRNGSDRNYFESMLNRLLHNFNELYRKVSLSDCLWKLWIGSDLPIGTNLPIIASGFEMLVNTYLKDKKVLKKYTKEEKSIYNDLVQNEIDSLSKKLSSYEFRTFVLNKLKNPYNYGIGEKISIFFKSISIEFERGSLESEAIKARNLMTHQGIDVNTEEEQRKIKKISDAYVTLINRVILKLLDYDWYYVDYSKEGVNYLKMDENL
ncbi:hypothetical protein [Aquimarina macrocephali]|uniref:hypothetical protein n=1 Tax=Aquimarina macrocephali TaxID=666563 RepID=UPI003F67CA72